MENVRLPVILNNKEKAVVNLSLSANLAEKTINDTSVLKAICDFEVNKLSNTTMDASTSKAVIATDDNDKRRKEWPQKLIFQLLDEYKKQEEISVRNGTKIDWKEIAFKINEVSGLSDPVTSNQCSKKIVGLKKTYKYLCADSKSQGLKTWPFFDVMAKAFGDRIKSTSVTDELDTNLPKSSSSPTDSSSQYLSLHWSDYPKIVPKGFHSFYLNKDLVDVTIAIDGKYIKAHKIVLSVCSSYFQTLFTTTPCTHPIVFLKDVSYNLMKDLLTFMYTGDVNVREEDMKEFIKTGNALQIKGLLNIKFDDETNGQKNKNIKRVNEDASTSINNSVKRFRDSYKIPDPLKVVIEPEHNSTPEIATSIDSLIEEALNEDESHNFVEYYNFITLAPELKCKSQSFNKCLAEVVPGCTEEEFMSLFRISPGTFDIILNMIGTKITERRRPSGKHQTNPEKQILIALWFMATKDTYSAISSRFNVGKATVVRTLERVSKALSDQMSDIIKWPKDSEILTTAEYFNNHFGLPNTIGVLGTMACKIKPIKPSGDDLNGIENYRSIRLQAVCDESNKFINCSCSYDPAMNDYEVLQNSDLSNFFNSKEHFPDDTYHLIAGKTYPLHSQIMVPYTHDMNAEKEIFNQNLSVARQHLKQTFKLLKSRFIRLTDNLPLSQIENSANFALATCVLHNICVDINDTNIDLIDFADDEDSDDIYAFSDDLEACLKRDRICKDLNIFLE